MKAVFFDLFETLVSQLDPEWSPPPVTRAERLGVEDGFFREHWGRIERSWDGGEYASYEAALFHLCGMAGVDPDPGVVHELREERERYLRRTAFASPDPDVLEMLSALRAKGLLLAVLTNANELDVASWDDFGLSRFFDVFVSSHEVLSLKPDPEIYTIGCRRLGVEPSEAVFVGDGGSDELRGAQEVGLGTFWSTWFLDRWPAGARPNRFNGDDWREGVGDAPHRRLGHPRDLVEALFEGN